MPPGVVLASAVVAPSHTTSVPVIGEVAGLTVTDIIAVALPQLLVLV